MQSIKLEEYIPLKIIFNEDKEAVEYISYSKNKNSFLEFVVLIVDLVFCVGFFLLLL